MEQLLISPWFLAGLFFVVSLVYSATGLVGGTSYTALLAGFVAKRRAVPAVSLMLNVVVSLLVVFNYVRAGYARWPRIAAILTPLCRWPIWGPGCRWTRRCFIRC